MKTFPLFIAGTHGNETIGERAIIRMQTTSFDWIIGNPDAYSAGVRYLEKDLNRCGMGDANSPILEMRRAAEVLATTKQYSATIDLHGTNSKSGIFVIVPNPTPQNMQLAVALNIQNIVVWPSITPEMQSPMCEFFDCGVEIECGNQQSKETEIQLARILEDFVQSFDGDIPDRRITSQQLRGKRLFQMVGSVQSTDVPDDVFLEEFTAVPGQCPWYPVFIDTYGEYDGVLCYKLNRITVDDLP